MYGFYITQAGIDKFTEALSKDTKVIINTCAVGDGATDNQAKDLTLTALKNEVYRKTLDGDDHYGVLENNPGKYYIEVLIPEEAGEITVNEAGFFDTDGTLLVYGTMKPVSKPENYEGGNYLLDLTNFIEFSNEQIQTLEVDLGRDSIQALNERFDSVEVQVNNIDEKVDGFDSRVENVESSVATANSGISDLNDSVDTLNSEITRLEGEIQTGLNGKATAQSVKDLEARVLALETTLAGVAEFLEGIA